MANMVKYNKAKLESAEQNLDAEDAWGEVALDSRGYMYVVDKNGNISTVRPDKYDSNKHKALSNEEMVGLRERSDKFAMNTNLLSNLNSAIGMKTIQKHLLDVVGKLGSRTIQGYASKEDNEIVNGIKELMHSGPNGYYKITNKQQASDIKSALTYLYNQLTPQMKKTLDATIVAEGGDLKTDKFSFLSSILIENIDSEQKVDFDQSATKHVLEQTDTDKTKTEKDTYLNRIATGQGEYYRVGLAPSGAISNRGGMMVQAVDFGGMLSTDLKSILPQMNLHDLRTQAEAFKATFDQDVTFGNQLLSAEEERGIL
jgi:hypothetical protein